MKPTSIVILLLCLVVLLPGSGRAQVEKKAQAGFRFLENPVSAEVVGRGATGVTTTQDANGIFWNPALLGWVQNDINVTLNRTQGIADINYNAIAAAFHLWDNGVLGVSFLSMDYGTFYGTRVSNNAEGYEETGEFTPHALALGVAFSQKVSNRFSYGVQLKYVYQNLGNAYVAPYGTQFGDPDFNISTKGYSSADWAWYVPLAIDVGAYYDFLYKGIRFGATLTNISREFKYESEQFPMPFAVSFGLMIEPLQFFMDGSDAEALRLCFESRHPRDYDQRVKFGAEYSFLEAFTARVGYQGNYDERGFTAGIGLHHEVGGIPLQLDYAYEAFGIFGGVHHISLGAGY